jgi:pimeloyl-ACP methyl ester carboxylesterase
VSLAQRRWAVDRALAGRPQAVRDSVVRVRQAEADTLVVRDPWVAHWWTYDPRPTAARVRVPVLVVQGATDRQVPPAQATELGAVLRRAGNRDVTVRVVPAVNHLLVHDPAGAGDLAGYRALAARTVRPDVLATIAEWVTTRARAQSLR